MINLYFKFYFLGTIRNIPALFFTLIFPPLIFVLSIHLWGNTGIAQRAAYLTFANYSVQTVCFMLLGMGVSQEKNSNWAHYTRTLPAPIWVMIIGRILHTIALSFMNLVILTIIATLLFSIPMSLSQIAGVFVICALGAIPFTLMGLTIGMLANQESARSIFTLLNLLFLFGSFEFATTGFIAHIQKFILTFQWVTLQKSIFDSNISIFMPIICMAIYSFVAVLSLLAVKK